MESCCEEKDCSGTQNLGSSLNIDSKPSLEAESHLQSLGFVMNNGKARFKLDDSTPAYSNISPTDFSMVDADDSLSFVVLGKDSLDSIQASSLASYVDIQQKSMSIDYNSMIASLNSTEIQQKLSELLQENGKLKETLKQNNVAMKQQFNTLATWQEEIMKIHQNHKKKFAETRELINYLKKENTELKMKLSLEGTDNTEMGYKIVDTTEVEDQMKEKETSVPEVELQEKVSSLTDELNSSKLKCAKLSSDVEKLMSISNLMSTQLKQATSTIQEQRLNMKKLELAAMSKQMNGSSYSSQSVFDSVTSKQSEDIKSTICEECSIKDKEINSLKESIAALEDKLQHATTPVQFCIKNPLNPKQYRQQHDHSVKQLSERLQELNVFFDKQINRYVAVKNTLNEVKEVLELVRITNTTCMWPVKRINLEHDMKELFSCCIKLIDEQMKLEEDRENVIKAQNQFQEVFFHYDSVLDGLEVTTEGNSRLSSTENNDVVSEAVQKIADLELQKTVDKPSLEKERKMLIQERESLEEETKSFISQKKELEIEYKNLNDAKELLQQERTSLYEEKASLDKQSQLYEDQEKSLQMEKKMLEMKLEQLVTEINTLHQSLQNKELQTKELQKQLNQHMENVDLLETQLKFYEEDFKQERKIKETLLEEKSKLDTDLRKQVEFNKQLQMEISRLKGLPQSQQMFGEQFRSNNQQNEPVLLPPVMSTFICPKCDCKFRSIESLEHHVQCCLNLD